MNISQEQRERVIAQAQGAIALEIAYIGVANGLLSQLDRMGQAGAEKLASAAGVDAGYVTRWCDAAFAFGYLSESNGQFRLTDLGQAFRPEVPGTLMPFAVQSVLSAHMAERAATFMKTGERPGEKVLAERESILPLFGPMLEANFGPLFEQQILSQVPAFAEIDARGGVAVDLGCGNGWYLRRLAARFPNLRGIGLDGFDENIRQAVARTSADGLGNRLRFQVGDIYHYTVAEPVDLIAMTRSLHHVWDEKEKVFSILRDSLRAGGVAVIWEPNWPLKRSDLAQPGRKNLAFQNLTEHVQGNHFLRPDEIGAEFERVGMSASVHLFANGNEAVIVGTKPG
ncbi:MAG: class I SAM-dependent methyltransferase [Acidiferrobacterales bacterium]